MLFSCFFKEKAVILQVKRVDVYGEKTDDIHNSGGGEHGGAG